MCTFVTVGVSDSSALEKALDGSGLGFDPCTNPSVKRSFPSTDKLSWIMVGGCSCGLVPPANALPADDEARLRRKYQAKGWPAAKIERAIKEHLGSRKQKQSSGHAKRFLKTLEQLIKDARGFRIFKHTYGGLVETESVPKAGTTKILFSDFLAAGGAFPEDEVLDVVDE